MSSFVGDYLATAPEDPRATFDQLTRKFQRESGGYRGLFYLLDNIVSFFTHYYYSSMKFSITIRLLPFEE